MNIPATSETFLTSEVSELSLKGRILVVDDNEANRDVLSRRLERQGHLIECACDGVEAISMTKSTEFDLILLDIMMPNLNGYEVLEAIKTNVQLRHIPIIMISALEEMDSIIKCVELGADDYLTKPFNRVLLKARVSSCLEKKRLHDIAEQRRQLLERQNVQLESRVGDQVRQILSTQLATILAMSKLAESKDPETGGHLDRMREYCRVVANWLATTEKHSWQVDERFVDNIYAASPLHDIGKVGIPDDILLKPGKLDSAEWEIMKTHCKIGANTLKAVDEKHPGNNFLKLGIEIAEAHHEKWDGTGYPFGLKGEQIPLSARIVALADVYDALTSKRCYKEPFTHECSREILLEGRGKHFDPDIVDAFLASEQQFISIRQRING